MKNWNNWTKKQKVTLGLTVACLVVAGAVGTNVYAKNKQEQAVTQALEVINKEKLSLKELDEKISTLRDKENPNFLVKDVDLKTLDAIDKQVDQLKKEHSNTAFPEVEKENKAVVNSLVNVESNSDAVRYQLMTQVKVSQLFDMKEGQYVIQGQEVNLALPTADDLTLDQIESVVSATRTEGKLMTIPESTDSKKSWEQHIDALTTEATKQVTEINALNEAVAKWFNQDNKPLDTIKRDELKAIEKRINSLKNQKAKEELSVKWQQVNKAVVTKEKAEADKKAKEQVAKESTTKQPAKGNDSQGNYQVDGNLNNSNWANEGSQNQGVGYNPPTNTGGGSGYTPPVNQGGGGYTPPTNGGGQGTTPPGYDGHATQDELDQQEIDASNVDHTQNPNSPWGKK